jgi:hypothetical protein
MSLSVCCFTAGPAALVAAQLSLFRPIADEIVVAVDDRARDDVVPACQSVADEVIVAPWIDPLERSLAWLHAQCSGTWVLRVDSDEIASKALLDTLPGLLGKRSITHFSFARRHLYPDAGHYIAESPWQPDYQLRLVRNKPERLRFSGRVHTSVEPGGRGRLVEAPLYHAESLLLSRSERLAKGRRYAELAGVSSSEAKIVLPEDFLDLPLRDVPPDDAMILARVLHATVPPARDRSVRAPVRRATRKEIDALSGLESAQLPDESAPAGRHQG